MKNTPTLGRGLSALLGEDHADTQLSSIPIEWISPNIHQPRRHFDSELLQELISSIREKGVLQPILVRQMGDRSYELIAGERRWRSAKAAGLLVIPVVILVCTEAEALEIGLIENLQRDNLNALEEAESLDRLITVHQKTQEMVAKSIGKSRSYVANMVRLTHLPEEIKEYLRMGTLSSGHGKILLNCPNATDIARQVVEHTLSVRETEKLVRNFRPIASKAPSIRVDPSEFRNDMELLAHTIGDLLSVPIKLSIKNKKAVLSMEFAQWEQLDELCQKLQSIPKMSNAPYSIPLKLVGLE